MKAQQQQENAILDFHTLAAPYDAMVTARLKERGSALGAGEVVFTLIDPQSVWVLAYIDESKAGEIRLDEPVDIVLRSLPDRYSRMSWAATSGRVPTGAQHGRIRFIRPKRASSANRMRSRRLRRAAARRALLTASGKPFF